jgi:hypothetical protein
VLYTSSASCAVRNARRRCTTLPVIVPLEWKEKDQDEGIGNRMDAVERILIMNILHVIRD